MVQIRSTTREIVLLVSPREECKKYEQFKKQSQTLLPLSTKARVPFPMTRLSRLVGRSIGGIVCGYNSRVAYVFDSQDAAATSFSASDAYDLLIFFHSFYFRGKFN